MSRPCLPFRPRRPTSDWADASALSSSARSATCPAAGGVLFVIATGSPAPRRPSSGASCFATNGYGAHSPGHDGLGDALLTEIVLTAAFLDVILGATDARTNRAFAPIAIGLALTLIHLISIPVPTPR